MCIHLTLFCLYLTNQIIYLISHLYLCLPPYSIWFISHQSIYVAHILSLFVSPQVYLSPIKICISYIVSICVSLSTLVGFISHQSRYVSHKLSLFVCLSLSSLVGLSLTYQDMYLISRLYLCLPLYSSWFISHQSMYLSHISSLFVSPSLLQMVYLS